MRSKQLTILLVGLMLAGSVLAIVVPAGLGWDFANFYDAGRRIAAGEVGNLYDPASRIAGSPPQGATGFFGTPLSALLYVPMSRFGAETALMLFKVQNVIALFAMFIVLFLFHRRFVGNDQESQWRLAALLAGACLLYQPFWTIFRVGGQTTPTVMLCMALALVCHTAQRYWLSSALVAAAVMIKPALAPALAFLILVSGWAFMWRAALVLGLVAVMSVAGLGWEVHVAFVDLMVRSSRLTAAWYYNSSLVILVDNIRIGLGRDAASSASVFKALTSAIQAGGLLLVLSLLVRSRRERWGSAARRHFQFMLAVFVFLLGSRTLWEHYLSLLFLPLAYFIARNASFSQSARRLVAAIVVLSMFQNLIFTNWLREQVATDSLPPLVAIALLKTAPLLLAVALLARHWPAWFRSYSEWPATAAPAPRPAE